MDNGISWIVPIAEKAGITDADLARAWAWLHAERMDYRENRPGMQSAAEVIYTLLWEAASMPVRLVQYVGPIESVTAEELAANERRNPAAND